MKNLFFIFVFSFVGSLLTHAKPNRPDALLPVVSDPDIEELAREIAAVFEQGSCAHVIGSRLGYPVISVACDTAYREQDRTAILDRVFRRGARLDREETSFARYNGSYLYSFTYRTIAETRRLFVKLHFRNSFYLYKNPLNTGRVAILIDELDDVSDLVRWQSLGLKLSYAVIPFKEDSAELAARIREYRQGLWLSLSLNPLEMSGDIAGTLKVSDVLEQGVLPQYIKRSLDALGPTDGVSDRNSREFFANLAALRALFAELKQSGIDSFFDTARNPGITALETARIMSLKANRADFVLKNCGSRLDLAARLHRLTKDKPALSVLVHSKDKACYAALKRSKKNLSRNNLELISVKDLP